MKHLLTSTLILANVLAFAPTSFAQGEVSSGSEAAVAPAREPQSKKKSHHKGRKHHRGGKHGKRHG